MIRCDFHPTGDEPCIHEAEHHVVSYYTGSYNGTPDETYALSDQHLCWRHTQMVATASGGNSEVRIRYIPRDQR